MSPFPVEVGDFVRHNRVEGKYGQEGDDQGDDYVPVCDHEVDGIVGTDWSAHVLLVVALYSGSPQGTGIGQQSKRG